MEETEKTTFLIVKMSRVNDAFRRVVMTGDKTQVVLMAIPFIHRLIRDNGA